MKATFFKRYFYLISGIFVAVSLFFSSLIASRQLRGDGRIVYFLMMRTDSVQAGASWISLQGGAGYVTSDGVALDVYFSQNDAEEALYRLSSVGGTLTVDAYVLPADLPEAFLGCLQVVGDCVSALESGATQSSARRVLEKQADIMAYLSQTSGLGAVGRAANDVRTIAQETIYASRLRYFLCETCESIAKRR